jgi:hypothetical protein
VRDLQTPLGRLPDATTPAGAGAGEQAPGAAAQTRRDWPAFNETRHSGPSGSAECVAGRGTREGPAAAP